MLILTSCDIGQIELLHMRGTVCIMYVLKVYQICSTCVHVRNFLACPMRSDSALSVGKRCCFLF